MQYAKLDGVEFEYLQTAIESRDEGAIICDVEWTEDGKLVKKEETARDNLEEGGDDVKSCLLYTSRCV